MNYSTHYQTRTTPQSEPIPGSGQVQNEAGGYTWAVDDWKRLDRFLILGNEGGTYYVNEHKLTIENAEAVRRCIQEHGRGVVERIIDISVAGRAPKNEPALFALAMASHFGDDETRSAAFTALPLVARIGTHLFHFCEYRQAFAGWGRGMRGAVCEWFGMPADKLAYQMVKYRQRDGWTWRDCLRLAHPVPVDAAHDWLYRYATKTELPQDAPGEWGKIVAGFELAQLTTTEAEWVRLIEKYKLSWEMLPTPALALPGVWRALLPHMPLTAMIRNLGRMAANGTTKPMSETDETRCIVDKITDQDALRKARVHPIALLSAMMVYRQGHGDRGNLTWRPVAQIVDALDAAFYLSFGNVTPTRRPTMLAVDTSGSMQHGVIAGVPGLTPAMAGAAMALVTAAVEPNYMIVGFDTELEPLAISPRQRLDDVLHAMRFQGGGTDCSLPMRYAKENGLGVDAFVLYTDSQSWYGAQHPAQAFDAYRRAKNTRAKLVTVSMTAESASIANPDDANSLDVVGFDTATPNVISDFVTA